MSTTTKEYGLSYKYIFALFILCSLPRIGLLMANTEGNDDHITPIQLWQQHQAYPEVRDCWECFQPPLFYALVLTICNLLDITSSANIFNTIQTINLLFGLSILWLITGYINSLKLEKTLSIGLILFWGLNPELVSIGALASNDTVAILLGMMCTILLMKHVRNSTLTSEITLALIVILLGITKGNGLIFIGILPIIYGFNFIKQKNIAWKSVARQCVIWVITLLAIAHVGNYADNYVKYNDPFIINVDPPYEKATWDTPGEMTFRKGVDTYKEAFFSFPLLSLLETPYNENGSENYPNHRKNLWTQMLGQFTNYLFERHPTTWSSVNNDMYNFSRINFILHILLIIAILGGIIRHVFSKGSPSFIFIGHFIIACIFIAFVIKYSAQYRDFCFMKVVFIYPAYISLIYLSTAGINKWNANKGIAYVLIVCSALYVINYFYLVYALIR